MQTVKPIIEALNKLRVRREADHVRVLVANSGVCKLLVQGEKAVTLFPRELDAILWPNRLAELTSKLSGRGIFPAYSFDANKREWTCLFDAFDAMCPSGVGLTPQASLEAAIQRSIHGDIL